MVAVAAGLAGAVAAVPTTADAASAPVETPRVGLKTTLTFEAPGCTGCKLGVIQGVWDRNGDAKTWNGPSATVRHGVATITIPTKRTHGLSVTVDAPWDGHLAAVTTVAFRYQGFQPGDPVGFRQARGQDKGSACWKGTKADAATVPLTVRKVRVDGVHGRVDGSIAFAQVTQEWMTPMRRVYDGVMASQDVNICGKR
jgi:hypothetical protein